MKYVILYLICGMLWALWEMDYMIHISGQFQEIMSDVDEIYRDKLEKFVVICSFIGIGLVWPLVISIDIPKVYIYDKIVYKKH